MLDISRFFNHSSKKRELSNNSNDGETSKKRRESSLNTSTSSDIPNDLFTESLKDTDCVALLLNCIKKMKDFITKKFDKYKQEKKEREKIINNLMENVAKLTKKVDDLTEAVEKQEQYSRHNCLLIHGIPEKKQENNDELCIKVVNEHLDLDIND